MQRLPQLTAKIASLDDLRELFRAMRAVAVTHVQQSHAALDGIRRYAHNVEQAIAEIAPLVGAVEEPFDADTGDAGGMLLVACAEHGFTGGFSERLLTAACEVRASDEALGVIGSRGIMRAGERGIEVAVGLPMATHLGGVPATARRAAVHLARTFRARIVYARYRRGADYDVQVRPILPLDPALLAAPAHDGLPLHQLAPATLLRELAGEYLYAELIRALTESFACQNAARLRLMEAADRNIDDRLSAFRRRAHALRQQQITTELLDIVVGAQAVLEDEAGEQPPD